MDTSGPAENAAVGDDAERELRLALSWRSIAIGLASGGRSTAAPAALVLLGGSGPGAERPLGRQLARWRVHPRVRQLAAAIAGAEVVVDKLPVTPSRLRPPGLGARVAAAGVTAGAVAEDGVLIQAVGAALLAGASAVVAVALRSRLSRHRPDWQVALVEDALVAAAVALAVR